MNFIGNRTRNKRIVFRVSDDEEALIKKKMETANILNREAYLRKMSLDGYIIRLDLSDIRKMTALLSNVSANINQIAKRINTTGDIYKSDIADIQAKQELLWEQMKNILLSFANFPR